MNKNKYIKSRKILNNKRINGRFIIFLTMAFLVFGTILSPFVMPNINNTSATESNKVGGFQITGGKLGTDYEYSSGELIIKTSKDINVSNVDPSSCIDDKILIESSTTNLTLSGVNISSGIDVDNNTLNLTLQEGSENILNQSTPINTCGIRIGQTGTLVIGGKGELTTYGGSNSGGIGSTNAGTMTNSGTLIINDGIINAVGQHHGTAIGGRYWIENVTINSGVINTSGDAYNGAIGPGNGMQSGKLYLNGGVINSNIRGDITSINYSKNSSSSAIDDYPIFKYDINSKLTGEYSELKLLQVSEGKYEGFYYYALPSTTINIKRGDYNLKKADDGSYSYTFPDLVIETDFSKFQNGGYFQIDVDNGRVELDTGQTLSEGFKPLGESGILIDNIPYNEDTDIHKTVNIPPNATVEQIQNEIRKYRYYVENGNYIQNLRIIVVNGDMFKDGYSEIIKYDHSDGSSVYRRYIEYKVLSETASTSNRTMLHAIKVATAVGGKLAEPKSDAELLALGKDFSHYANMGATYDSYHFLSFLGIISGTINYKNNAYTPPSSKPMGYASWESYKYASTGEFVKNYLKDTSIIYERKTLSVDIYNYMVGANNSTNIKVLGVDTDHGDNSIYYDPGVIVEFDSIESAGQRGYGEENKIVCLPIDISGYAQTDRTLVPLSTSDNSATISQNEVFTARFDSQYKLANNVTAETKVSLENKKFPKNTKITFVDYISGVPSYYYYIVNNEEISEVDIKEFVEMGGTRKYTEPTVADDDSVLIDYQFVVDFSDVEPSDYISLGDMNFIMTISLKINSKEISSSSGSVSININAEHKEPSGTIDVNGKNAVINAAGPELLNVCIAARVLDANSKQVCLNSNNIIKCNYGNEHRTFESIRGGLAILDLGKAVTDGQEYNINDFAVSDLPNADYRLELILCVIDESNKDYPLQGKVSFNIISL